MKNKLLERITCFAAPPARAAALIAAIYCTEGAFAVEKPEAIWFMDMADGSERNGYVISANGNTISDGYITLNGTGGGVTVKNDAVTSTLNNLSLGAVVGFEGISYSETRTQKEMLVTLYTGTTEANANYAGFAFVPNNDSWYQTYGKYRLTTTYNKETQWTGGATYSNNVLWPSDGELHYLGVTYRKNGLADQGWRSYIDKTASSYAGSTVAGGDTSKIVYGVTVGGTTSGNRLMKNESGNAKVKYLAILRQGGDTDSVKYWSLTSMTKSLSNTFVGSDASTGVSLSGNNSVTISGSIAAAAVFVQENTTLVFEEGASLTIGGGAGPLYVAEGATLTIEAASGSTVASLISGSIFGMIVMNSYVATISGDTTWSDSMWDETATWINGEDARINVSDDAIFTIPSSITAGTLYFTIADGKTLSLDSEGTISQIVANGGSIAFAGTTATTQYPISGTSVIKVPDNTQLTVNAAVTTSGGFNIGANATLVAPHTQVSSSTGAFTGGATATVKMTLSSGTTHIYDQTSPYNNWNFSDSSTWNGTVVLSGTCGVWKMIQFGNSTSKVVIDGLESYIATYKSDTQNDWHNIGTLEIASGGWKVTGGYTSGVMVFPATLTGSGDITVSISGSTRLFFTGDTSAFTGGITIKDTTASDYTGGFGAVTTACQVHIIPTSTATADPTQLANTGYTANTIAVGAGGEATVASTATWTAPEGFIVNGTLNLGSASGLDSAGTLKGTGMIVMPSATLPGSALQKLLQNTNWQGTLAISNQTVSELNPNLYGNEGSKVQLSGMSGWFVKPRTTRTIAPEIVFENGSYSYAFKPTNGYSYNSSAGNDGNNAANYNIFKKISGSGTLAQDSDKGYSQLYWIKDGSGFTGSVVQDNVDKNTIIVFAGDATEPSTETHDATYAVSTLHVLSGTSATLGADSTWQPGSAIKISGAVEIAGSGTMVNPVTLNDGATLTFDALDSSAAALSLSSTLTVNSTVNIAFGSGVTPAAGLILMQWVKTGSTATAAAFALADVSLPYELSVVEGETYNTLVLADVDVTVDGISIPDEWLVSTATAENITVAALAAKINAGTAAANGRKYDVCYALGLSTTDATDDFIIAVTSANGTLTAILRHSDGTEITAASGVALTVTLKYGNGVAAMTNSTVGASGASSTFAIDPAQGDFGETGAIFYKIEVAISASGS